MNGSQKILLTGGTGLVGNYIAGHFGSGVELFVPSHRDVDITNANNVYTYIATSSPDVIIHCAAFTDNTDAERQRGNKRGMCWRVNVEGTKNIVNAGKINGAYIIFISTGSVFAGDEYHPGPFTESDPASPDDCLSWYGVTKKEAEKFVGGAIIRLSHPVARPDIIEVFHPKQDYITHLLSLFDTNKLFPLFTDQKFTLTYMDDVIVALKKLIDRRLRGIFHVVSYDTVCPYELAKYAIYKARHVEPNLTKTTFDEFIKTQQSPLRFSKYGAITGAKTAHLLQNPVRTWREIVDCITGIRRV